MKQAILIAKIDGESAITRSEIKAAGVSLENIKALNDGLARVEKDFAYLLHPSKLPRSYEKALIEVARRRKYRRLIDEEYSRIKKAVKKEQETRNMFMSEFGRLLPSEFFPNLREQAAVIRIEGGLKDYELPDINEDLAGSVFDSLLGGTSSNDTGHSDPQLLKKYNDLIQEQNLLKEEHKSNIKDLTTKIDDLEI